MKRFLRLTFSILISALPLSAATIQYPGDYDHLQRAVNAAEPGDTILIAPGTYETTITITKSLKILGSGKEQTILKPNPKRSSVIHFTRPSEDNAAFTLKDLTIQHKLDADENNSNELLSVEQASPFVIENVHLDNSPSASGTYIGDTLLQAKKVSLLTKYSPTVTLNSLRTHSEIDNLQITITTTEGYRAESPINFQESCQVELSNIDIKAAEITKIATVIGNLSRVYIPDASIPTDKIQYYEGARAEGPTDELVQLLKEEAEQYGMMNMGHRPQGPGESANFLAKLEPQRRELARELQEAISSDGGLKSTHKALVKYISGLISHIEYGPTDFAADPSIHAELKHFESKFGVDATSDLIKALPPHPEMDYYRQDHAYYVRYVSPEVRKPLNEAAQAVMLLEVKDMIEASITNWPKDAKTEPTAKGFFDSIRKLSYKVHDLRFPYDTKIARAKINTMALDAIGEKLSTFDIELIRSINEAAPAARLGLVSVDQLTAMIETMRAAQLQETALAETLINTGPNALINYIWKSPDGQYMITSDIGGTYLYDAQTMRRLKTIKSSKDLPIYLSNTPVYRAHSKQVLLPLKQSVAVFDLDRRMIVGSIGTAGKPWVYYSQKSQATYTLTTSLGDPFSNLIFSRNSPAPSVSPKYTIPVSKDKTHYPAHIHELNETQFVVQYYDDYLMPIFTATFDATKDSKLQEVKTDLGRLVTTESGQLLAIKNTSNGFKENGSEYTTIKINHLGNDQSLQVVKSINVKLPYNRSKYAAQTSFPTKANSQQIAISDTANLCIINYETGAVDGIIREAKLGSNASIEAILIEDAENILLSYNAVGADGVSRNRLARHDIKSGKHLADLGKPAHFPNQLFADTEQSDLYTLNNRGTLKRVRMNSKGFTIKTLQHTTSAFAINSESGLIAYANRGQNKVYLTDRESILDGQDILPVDSSDLGATIDSLFFSLDGSMLGIRTQRKFYALSVDSGETVFEMTFTQAHGLLARNPGFFSPDGSIAVISQYKASSFDKGYGIEKWIGFDVETGEMLWETSAKGGNFAGLDASGTKAFISRGKNRMVLDIETGERIGSDGTYRISNRTWAATTPDGGRIATSDETDIIQIGTTATETNDLTNESKFDNEGASINALTFLADPNFLAATDRDGFIRIWDLNKKALIAKVTLFESDAEWAITTPDNRFDTAPGTSNLVYFLAGKELLDSDALFETYYTPKLLPTLLSGSSLEPVPELSNQTVPPRVNLGLAAGSRGLFVEDDDALIDAEVATVRLKAEAFSMNGSISEIRLYHNEKLITTATRGLFVEDDIIDENRAKTKEYTVNLLPGENTFVARAFDNNRIEGRSKVFKIKSAESDESITSSGGLNLHIIAVGIDTYTNSKYDLNYAVADASAFLKQIEGMNQQLFTSITPYFISNREATGAAIIQAFETVKQRSGPRDVFIFYYAGHGVMAQSADKEFYLVPTDVTQLYGDDAQLARKAISSKQLLELSKNIPAQKQLFILDACQSAGALQSIAMRGAAEEKAIAQLARSTGTHWLTASGSEQFATEFSELGHGAFTYTLLQALEGHADTGDARITVNELKAYLESQVPEVTAKYKGTPQYPSSYGYGNDFPVGALTK